MENSRVQPEVLNQAWLQLPPWQPLTLEARRDARRGEWLAGEMLGPAAASPLVSDALAFSCARGDRLMDCPQSH